MEVVNQALTHWVCCCLFCNHPKHLPASPLVPSKLWSSWLKSFLLTLWESHRHYSSVLRRSPRSWTEVDRKLEEAMTWPLEQGQPVLWIVQTVTPFILGRNVASRNAQLLSRCLWLLFPTFPAFRCPELCSLVGCLLSWCGAI